jgi:hypothetical protein
MDDCPRSNAASGQVALWPLAGTFIAARRHGWRGRRANFGTAGPHARACSIPRLAGLIALVAFYMLYRAATARAGCSNRPKDEKT